MKVIKVDSSNDQGADFQPIDLDEVFEELIASMEETDVASDDSDAQSAMEWKQWNAIDVPYRS